MPTYQYACRSCGHEFEAVQGFHEDALRICPQCQQEDLRKLFGNVGVVFKGSGFYRTDSRASGKSGGSEKSKPKSESAASSASASGTSGTATAPATPAPSSSKAPAST
jgi:putative FmdB family regulatory protein